jgi:transcriptional regulator with XRE-family HTH domain
MKGEKLIEWRRKYGVTQSELAHALGVDMITVSRWERGMQEPIPFLGLALEALENRIRQKEGISSHIAAQKRGEVDSPEVESLLLKIFTPQPPTYKRIQHEVKRRFGYTPKTCWIAHVKEIMALTLKEAHNRQGLARVHPCPTERIAEIKKVIEDLMSR